MCKFMFGFGVHEATLGKESIYPEELIPREPKEKKREGNPISL